MRSASDLARRSLFDVFDERDAERRAEAGADLYAADIEFHEREGLIRGPAATVARAGELLDQAPGARFTLRRVRDTDGTLSIVDWAFGPDEDKPLATGTDVVLVAGNRIQALYTTLD